jgi:Centromere DNA-binding protein complex CBF3 subunit, domain 2/Transcriptional activator of glycolytic enzymes
MVEAYLSHLPRKFMRRVAGFTSDEGGYFLPRAQAAPPAELVQKIWPWVEEWEERFRQRCSRKTWEEGGLDEDDVAGQSFLTLLRHLRVVLLQDLAVLQPAYPDLPFFRHAAFRGPTWDAYAELVRAAVQNPEYSRSLLLEQVMPEVSHAVYNSRDSLHQQAQHLHAALKVQQAQLSSQLAALATQMSTVTAIAASLSHLTGGGQLPLTIQFGAPPSGSVGVGVGVGVAVAAAPGPGGPVPVVQPVQRGGRPAAEPAQRPPTFELLPLHTIGDLWTAWKEGVGGQQAVEALEEAWGKDWRREGRVAKWYSARRPLVEKVSKWIIQGYSTTAAIERVECERSSRSLDRFYKDYVKEKNKGVVIRRRARED